MATSQMTEVIQHLRRAVLLRDGAGLTDGQLLADYLSRRDEAALAALVRRHGPMVWGVCRRILRNHHDAEDAFQATFLVLIRKAASVVPKEMVANWLYGVAHQTALKARSTTAKRRARERQVTAMPEPAMTEPDLWHDLQPLLDQELSRLPDMYRVAIVLCDLEGKTRKEAARQLGVPDGTLAARLARGRVMLAKRLAGRGLVVSGGSLAAVLAQNVASAGVPTAVLSSTIKAASLYAAGQAAATGVISAKVAVLTEGVLKAMYVTKLKVATAALLLAAVLGISGLAVTRQTQAADPPTPKKDPAPQSDAKDPEKPQPPKPLKGDGRMERVVWGPDGKTVATLIHDSTGDGKFTSGSVKLWDPATGEVKQVIAHSEEIQVPNGLSFRGVAFSPDRKTLATAASGMKNDGMDWAGEIKLWNIQTGDIIHRLEHDGTVSSVAFSPDGKIVAMACGMFHLKDAVKLWDVKTGKLLRSLEWAETQTWGIAFSPDGKTVAVAGCRDGGPLAVTLWDTETGKLKHTLENVGGVWSVAFSPDGKTLACGGGGETASLWDTQTGKLKHTLTGNDSYLRHIAFSPDGKTVAGAAIDKTAKLWEAETGKLTDTLEGHDGIIMSLAFSPDGKTLASGSADQTVRFWDLAKRKIEKK